MCTTVAVNSILHTKYISPHNIHYTLCTAFVILHIHPNMQQQQQQGFRCHQQQPNKQHCYVSGTRKWMVIPEQLTAVSQSGVSTEATRQTFEYLQLQSMESCLLWLLKSANFFQSMPVIYSCVFQLPRLGTCLPSAHSPHTPQ